ncbi:hypothetical protein STEG23_019473 [Scotinomys teguina]
MAKKELDPTDQQSLTIMPTFSMEIYGIIGKISVALVGNKKLLTLFLNLHRLCVHACKCGVVHVHDWMGAQGNVHIITFLLLTLEYQMLEARSFSVLSGDNPND